MSYRFDFDSTNQILRCRFDGSVSDEILKEYYAEATRIAGLTNPVAGILDFSDVTAFDVSPQTVRDLARSQPAISGPSRPRIIVAPSANVYGLARMFQSVGRESRPELHVVRSLQEAYELLKVREPRFDPVAAQ